MRIAAIGEILWDVIGEQEHLGGAPFNFSSHAARLGHEVRFISAIGDDNRGRLARRRARELGLSTRHLRTVPGQPTGTVTVTIDATGQPAYTLDRPAAYDFPQLAEPELAATQEWQPDWVYFGTLHQISSDAASLTRLLIEWIPRAKRLYDVNLRRDSYNASLVTGLLEAASVVKLNEQEAVEVSAMLGFSAGPLDDFCRRVADRFSLEAVCVTRGERGCGLLALGEYCESPGYPVKVADTVGAGDAFSAAFLHGWGCGWSPRETADFANRVGALVASQAGAVPDWTLEQAAALKASGARRGAGGTAQTPDHRSKRIRIRIHHADQPGPA